jgi:hypothetical protein
MITRRELLGAAVALTGVRLQPIRFALAAGVAGPLEEGIRFGLREASRATTLLGRPLELANGAATVIERNAGISTPEGRFTLIAAGEEQAAAIEQALAAGVPRSAGLRAAHWHHSLFKYGASELNERFGRAHARSMSQDHWLGWLAVKIIAEGALRAHDGESIAASIARGRFDGHKGVALRFDPRTRRLRQPLYVVDSGRDAVVWPA